VSKNSLELKDNCVKIVSKSRRDVSKSVWSPIDEKFCQNVDEISANLFSPQLMKGSVKKLTRFLHELTRIEGNLCKKVDEVSA
jgi:hypothetical protein